MSVQVLSLETLEGQSQGFLTDNSDNATLLVLAEHPGENIHQSFLQWLYQCLAATLINVDQNTGKCPENTTNQKYGPKPTYVLQKLW